MNPKQLNLKQALKSNKLTDFIKARSKEEKKGNKEKFDKAIQSISQTSSKALKSSTSGKRES
jgi:hypothetical protein